MRDVALVVGHHPDASGAALTLAGRSVHEHELWKEFARELGLTLEAKGLTGTVVHRPHEEPGQALADRINATGADVALSLHFNAATPGASGTEMLHWPGSPGGARLAWHLHKQVTGALGTPARGTKERADLPVLKLTEMPTVVCEPAFGSDDADSWALLTRQAELMKAYRDALLHYFTETNGRL